jgi:hypothetical protein
MLINTVDTPTGGKRSALQSANVTEFKAMMTSIGVVAQSKDYIDEDVLSAY